MARGIRPAARALLLAALVAIGAGAATAEWLQPDPSLREALLLLRVAVRDTIGHGDDPARLDSLGLALMRVGRLEEAALVLRRVLAAEPRDAAAAAAMGKMALFSDRLDEADSLLTLALQGGREPDVVSDLYAVHLRRGAWARAAELAPDAGDAGRVPLLEAMAAEPPYRIASAPRALVRVPWQRSYPTPLVRVKLNGESMLMALDTGARDLLLDTWAARRAQVRELPSQSRVFWNGTRIGARNAMVQRLEIEGLKVEALPAGIASLRKWSLSVNPYGEPVAGVIGLGFLRAFSPTLDYEARVLELRPAGTPVTAGAEAPRVPYEIWGESELTVYGTLAGSRRMALLVQTGLPECGVAAPAEVFDEIGVKGGAISKAVKSTGSLLQGRPWVRVTVPTLSIGPVVVDKVPGWSGAMDSGELWRHGVRRDAILSHDAFRGRRVTFDWDARMIVLEEP